MLASGNASAVDNVSVRAPGVAGTPVLLLLIGMPVLLLLTGTPVLLLLACIPVLLLASDELVVLEMRARVERVVLGVHDVCEEGPVDGCGCECACRMHKHIHVHG